VLFRVVDRSAFLIKERSTRLHEIVGSRNLEMFISLIIPAFNEAAYLGDTLISLHRAKALLNSETDLTAEIIVVDNDSDDSSPDVARAFGAAVVTETQHNVARVRNTGARVSRGDVLVFVDADTTVPDKLLVHISAAMSDASCFGGAVDTDYSPKKLLVRTYLKFWRIFGKLMGMAQGATQFCRRDVFLDLNGYDESLFMGEDVDFHWRLKRFARQQQGRVVLIADPKVVTSARRFDQWSLWRTLVWTNPLFILLLRRRSGWWNGWYKTTLR
jgi:glycosyltransferase involved in cell wall biosynthesis